VRLALLEADVNLDVARRFVAQVRERALGEEVRKSLTPGQQVVKIVHEELTELMGSGLEAPPAEPSALGQKTGSVKPSRWGDSRLAFAPRPPTTILLAG